MISERSKKREVQMCRTRLRCLRFQDGRCSWLQKVLNKLSCQGKQTENKERATGTRNQSLGMSIQRLSHSRSQSP